MGLANAPIKFETAIHDKTGFGQGRNKTQLTQVNGVYRVQMVMIKSPLNDIVDYRIGWQYVVWLATSSRSA